MKVDLAYGKGKLRLALPESQTDVIEPASQAGLVNERQSVIEALEQPVGSEALSVLARRAKTICITFTDITRATPNHRLIPWLLEALGDFPREQITLVNQLGTHRPNSDSELRQMLTPEVVDRYRVVNHEPENRAMLVQVGKLRDGSPALLNRHVVEADLRIVTGFIEPHFFAGFSGGPKGIIPGCAALSSVMANHRPENIDHPKATFGVTFGNPLWEELREIAVAAGPSFLLNVALNDAHEITAVFAGDLIQAHQVGCALVGKSALQSVDAPYDLVITSNSGYPLDLNLYQAIKGLTAAARIIRPGGTIILAAECCEGVPEGSPYDKLLRSVSRPEELFDLLSSASHPHPEQWQAQIQAIVQRKARVILHSTLSDTIVRRCHFEPCADIEKFVFEACRVAATSLRIAVLPQGPLTIPVLPENE